MGFADFDIMGKCADIISKVGATGDTGGSTSAGTISAKLNALLTSWTSTRAGYIDNIRSYTLTNNTASKTGVLSSKLSYLISLLENSTYGLNAIKSASSSAGLKSVTKTYNSSGVFSTGLTNVQFAGLYCVYVEGTISTSTGTKIVNIADYGASVQFDSDKVNASSPKKFFVSAAYVSGYTPTEAGIFITKNQISVGTLSGLSNIFNGSVTYYYF